VTKQLGSDGLGVWEVLGSDKPELIRSFSGFASFRVLRVRARLHLDTARAPAHRHCAWGCCASFRKDRYVFGAPARPHAGRASKRGKINVTPLEKRAVGGSDEGGSDEAKNHFPSLPVRANQEAGFVPTPRYGRRSDLEVIVEVIGSADRLPLRVKG